MKDANIIQTTSEKFNKVKKYLDGLVFWRELPNNKIEIKTIPKYVKWIDSRIFQFLSNN